MSIWLGITFGLLASMGFAASAVTARLGLQRIRTSTSTLISLVVGSLVTMVLAFSFYSGEILALEASAFLWFALVAFVNFPLGRLLNYTGVGLAGVSRASPIVGTSPLFAMALAVLFVGETVNVFNLLGTLSIIGGLVLILSQKQ